MAFVILGLLLLRPMSLYDLVKAFESGVSLFYSASTGSIKRALDQLLAEGHVEVEAAGARGRKVYRATDAGREALHTWLVGDLTGPSTETAALSRLFFLGLLEPPERAGVLGRIRGRVAADLAQLQALDRELHRQEVPEDLAEVFRYQRATLAYGLASHQHALDWFTEHVEPATPED